MMTAIPFDHPVSHKQNSLRFFLDTAEMVYWRNWLPTGLFYGVTTNPVLLHRANQACSVANLRYMTETALQLGAEEIQLQTWGASSEQMLNTAFQLAEFDKRVVIKVPVTLSGVATAKQLIADEIKVTMTGVYMPHQVLTAAAIGAEYAAPYLGRINDTGRNGLEDLQLMQQMLDPLGHAPRLLVASIRSIDDITRLAACGVNTFTFSEKIAQRWFHVAETEQAAVEFENAAQLLQT